MPTTRSSKSKAKQSCSSWICPRPEHLTSPLLPSTSVFSMGITVSSSRISVRNDIILQASFYNDTWHSRNRNYNYGSNHKACISELYWDCVSSQNFDSWPLFELEIKCRVKISDQDTTF
jgi:hypothetical protein